VAIEATDVFSRRARAVGDGRAAPGASRLLIVGSSMGSGHLTAARELARRARHRGASVRVVDYLALPAGPQGRLVRELYRRMVTHAPGLYDGIIRGWRAHPALFERLSAVGEGAYINGLEREFAAFPPTAVISTYNLAGQLLGRMRRGGRLDVPLIAYVTDAGAHPYWVSDGADLHLAPLSATARALSDLGAARVQVVEPLVAAPAERSRSQARATLNLPPGRVALVNGGSWGVGAVRLAAGALGTSGTRTYVLCGQCERLARAVRRLPGCHAVGWTDDVAAWIAAADVVVDSAGGTTCWEAIVAGRPVVLHRPLAGHGRLNAATLRDAGLVTVTQTDRELQSAVRSAPAARPDLLPPAPDPAAVVLATAVSEPMAGRR